MPSYINIKNMTHNEIYAYILNLKKELNKYKRLYTQEHKKAQDCLLKHCVQPKKEKIKEKTEENDDIIVNFV